MITSLNRYTLSHFRFSSTHRHSLLVRISTRSSSLPGLHPLGIMPWGSAEALFYFCASLALCSRTPVSINHHVAYFCNQLLI